MSAEDSLAICMLGILTLAGATVATIFFSLMRNAGKKDELEELLTEKEPVYPDGKKTKKPGNRPLGWEKDADWWKS